MIRLEDCRFLQWRSVDDEAAFFAHMGRFFASRSVRRECGGYPLDDGPRYRWFVAQHPRTSRVLGFVSVEEMGDRFHLRQGYVRPEARGAGIFGVLRDAALAHADEHGVSLFTRVPKPCAPLLQVHGFVAQAERGQWTTLMRNIHARSNEPDPGGRSVVPAAGPYTTGAPGGGNQRNSPATA